ncbi:MAG: Co2+/Mg2+ efflux protein ApaG [Caulobacterales bacterium]|jgi:ApaG protein|nr:Co2+/Mg2+ efflux protein ApaG [Caulobacterales bacterium]
MYEQETAGVVVRVEPNFLAGESKPDEGRFVWAYTIEIENRSGDAVKLISRFWRITDENGHTQEVHGEGVVGKQPLIAPGESFRYTSAAPLGAPSGVMMGSYSMVRPSDGEAFDIAVPLFALDSPHVSKLAN